MFTFQLSPFKISPATNRLQNPPAVLIRLFINNTTSGHTQTKLASTGLLKIITRPKHIMALPSSPLEIDVMEDFVAAARAARATISPLEPESLSKRLCGTTTLTGATEEDTATLLALAHCTGWSADRIALAFNELRSTELTAEQVWDFHEDWMVKTKEENRSLDLLDIAVMKALVNKFGVSKVMFGTPLSETTRPVCYPLNS